MLEELLGFESSHKKKDQLSMGVGLEMTGDIACPYKAGGSKSKVHRGMCADCLRIAGSNWCDGG